MHHNSIIVNSVLDALILACEGSVRRLARKYGSYGVVESDDLYIVAMIEVCKLAQHAYQSASDPVSYLCAVAKYAMLEELGHERSHAAMSLDAPLSVAEGDSLTLQDVLPAPSMAPAVEPAAASVVRDALVRLSARQQAVLRAIYGFEGCGRGGSQREIGRALGVTQSAVSFHATRGRRALRRDAQLCEALGVEVER